MEQSTQSKKRCQIQLLTGGGKWQTFLECELEDNLFPDLTFTGRPVDSTERCRYVTTAPYLITHELEGKQP